jgi:hypothetical protein
MTSRVATRGTGVNDSRAKVLLILPSDVLDRARVLAGRATTELRLPVSLQIVLRALIEEGLKQRHSRPLLASLERQATAVRDLRRAVRARARSAAAPQGAHGRSHRRETSPRTK